MIRLCVMIFFAHTAFADADTVFVDVDRKKGNTYHFQLRFIANAPVYRVTTLLTDYTQLTRLNPTIISSRVLPSENQLIDRVEIRTRGCMLFFCRTVRRVEDVTIASPNRIESVIVPSLSDFKSGKTLWTFVSEGQQTIVHYHATMVPDFWLPPFIGPRSLKKQIRVQLKRTARAVNRLLTPAANG